MMIPVRQSVSPSVRNLAGGSASRGKAKALRGDIAAMNAVLSLSSLSARSSTFEGQRLRSVQRAAPAQARPAALEVNAVQNLIGEVVSTKMQKSVVVTVRRQVRHRITPATPQSVLLALFIVFTFSKSGTSRPQTGASPSVPEAHYAEQAVYGSR